MATGTGKDGGNSPDEALVRALYETHSNALLSYVMRLTGDRLAAEDIVQEAILRAWRHPDVLVRGKDYARCWLIKVARRIVIDRVRGRQARPQEVAEDPDRPPVEGDHAERVVDVVVLEEGLSKLSAIHREVIEQVFIRGCTAAEAAKTIGVPEGTIKSRIARALLALRNAIGGPAGGSEERSA